MFEYAFMQNAFIVAILISIVCPLIGIFLVLRRYSMIGDALSHASLAGVAVGDDRGQSPPRARPMHPWPALPSACSLTGILSSGPLV